MEGKMDFLSIITILTVTVGSTYVFYMIIDSRINRMEQFHREDFKHMDEKWERLFDRLLLKDQEKEKF